MRVLLGANILIILSFYFVHMEFIIETLSKCNNKQFVAMETEKMELIDYKIHSNVTMTSQYNVGYVDSHFVGNFSWDIYNDIHNSTILIRMKLFVDEDLNDMKYYMMNHHDIKSDSETSIYFPCIVIPLSPNISIKTELFLLDTRSCDCGLMGDKNQNQLCLNQCELSLLYEEIFNLSLDACHIYNQYIDYNKSPLVDEQSRILPDNTTIFSPILTNINPFTYIKVWIFPSDDDNDGDNDDADYSPLVSWETWSDPSGKIHLDHKKVNHRVNKYYLMFITYCSSIDYQVYYTDDVEYDSIEISDTHTVTPAVTDEIYDLISLKQQQQQRKSGWFFGLKDKPTIAIIIVLSMVSVVSVVVVLLWWRVKHHKVIPCSLKSSNHVLQHSEEVNSEKLLDSIHKTSDLNNRQYLQDTTFSEDIPEPILIHHAFTPTWQTTISDFRNFLTDNKIFVRNVHSDLTENWYDFAEKAGTVYPNVIFILSSELLEILKIYKNKEPKEQKLEESTKIEEKWNKLMTERQWNLIPCVVLNKLRILYYDKKKCFRVHLITFSDEKNSQKSNEIQHIQFLKMFGSFLNSDNTICYNIETNDLKNLSLENSDLDILVKLLSTR